MHQAVQFNAELIRRYDITGPRYTSYPTALQFHEGFDTELYRRYVRLSNDELIPAPLSLYVHLPFCHSLCYYCGCNKKVTRHPEHGVAYLQRLQREIDLRGQLFDRDRLVNQLHFGGGTPTFFDGEQLRQLMRALGQAFTFSPAGEREFSIEVDPRTVDHERLAHLAELGFNRISLGVQDTDEAVQRAINRVQNPAATMEMVAVSRKLGFESVSVDLIYGLPLQTRQSFRATLETVIAERPDRLAVYSYAHMPQVFRSQRMISEADLPSPGAKLELMDLTIGMLVEAGYVYIGMDHFALPDDDLARAKVNGHLHRNFQGYSTHSGCDLVGLGVSAISRIGDSFCQNLKEIPRWTSVLDQGQLPVWRGIGMTTEDRLRSAIIEAVMCQGRVDFGDIENRFGVDFADHFALEIHQLALLARDGLIELEEYGFSATAEGRLLLRAIAMVFDEYQPRENARPRFSRVI